MIAILTQLLIGLSEDEGYKVRPVCGRTFMYKRGKAGTVARRSNSTYCSDYCPRKANHDKDARKSHSRGYAEWRTENVPPFNKKRMKGRGGSKKG